MIRNPKMFMFHGQHVMDIARVVRKARKEGVPVRTFWANWIANSAYSAARARPPSDNGPTSTGSMRMSSLYYAGLLVWMSNLTTPKELADA
jgi:hypothetical protein